MQDFFGGELVTLWNIVEKHINRLSWNFQGMSEMTQGEIDWWTFLTHYFGLLNLEFVLNTANKINGEQRMLIFSFISAISPLPPIIPIHFWYMTVSKLKIWRPTSYRFISVFCSLKIAETFEGSSGRSGRRCMREGSSQVSKASPEIRLLKYMTLKIQCQGHGWDQITSHIQTLKPDIPLTFGDETGCAIF